MTALSDYQFKTPPFDHQLKELEAHALKQNWAHFWEMGTGKSKVVVDNFALLYLQGRIDTVVIIAKKGEYANWAYKHVPEHLPESVPRQIYLYSTYKSQLAGMRAQFEKLVEPGERRLRIYIVNCEALPSALVDTHLTRLYKSAKGVFFVADESTWLKSTTAARSKKAYYWGFKSHYRRLMTGTPVTQSPEDLWGQSLVFGKGLFGTTSVYSFREQYLVREPTWIMRGGQKVEIKKTVGYKNIDRLDRYLDLFSSRLLKSECLDLPPKIYTETIVELTTEQERLYNQLRDQAILDWEGKELEVTHVLTLITKLHQLVCGQIRIDQDYHTIDTNRLTALTDLLEDYPKKAIIWCTYRQSLKDVYTKLAEVYGPESVVHYYGDTTESERQYAIENFQNSDSPVRFFVGNQQSGGYGTTLTAAELVVYYSNSYNLEQRLQSEDRAHRIGQDKKVTYVDFVTPGTVDERIHEVLRKKRSLAEEVMRAGTLRGWL